MSVEFFSNSQHHLWERCRMKESFFWENLVEREISRRTLWDVSSLPGRPREISFSLAGSTTAWAVCIFRPISGPNGDLKTSLRVLYFHERSNPDADLCPKIEIVFVGARRRRRPFGDQFVLLAANGVSVWFLPSNPKRGERKREERVEMLSRGPFALKKGWICDLDNMKEEERFMAAEREAAESFLLFSSSSFPYSITAGLRRLWWYCRIIQVI